MTLKHQPGEIIQDRYCITGVLGKGGVAITYSAIDLKTDSPALKDIASHIAIKVISLKQLDNWKQIELFQREAEVLKKLEHSAIPSYIDYFDIETDSNLGFYLVQQLAPGKSLFQLVESGWRVGEKEVKDIAQQVLEILSYLHSLDPPVIHRDIKPNNLIRSDDGKIYLVDFGAVQNTYYNTLMQGSTVVGTYGYMSPEQFRGQALPATDLYSLGATLLYLLTHRSPAELPQDTLKLNFRSVVNISESFADWLDKILEPDIEDRFNSADVALVELFKSKKKKQRKLITSLLTVILAIGLVAGANSYKWFFLSRLGYKPSGICSDEAIIKSYIKQGGKTDITAIEKIRSRKKPILNCIIKLHTAESHDKEKLVRLLIDKGWNVNQKDEEGNTPLLLAAGYRKEKNIVKLLLENGADPDVKNDQDETPISTAIYKQNKFTVQLLIDNGADTSYLNPEKIKEVHRMNDKKYLQIKKFLNENEFNISNK